MSPTGWSAGLALVDPVDLGAAVRLELPLHPSEPLVDAVPARRDEVDEQGQVIDASVPLGEEVVLEPLQAADRLSGETTYLCQLTADRSSLGADALANGVLDPAREGRLELRGELGERLDLARARSRAASTSPCALRPSAASSSRCLARAIAASSMGGNASVRVG